MPLGRRMVVNGLLKELIELTCLYTLIKGQKALIYHGEDPHSALPCFGGNKQMRCPLRMRQIALNVVFQPFGVHVFQFFCEVPLVE